MGKNGGTILDSLPSTQVSELISNVVALQYRVLLLRTVFFFFFHSFVK